MVYSLAEQMLADDDLYLVDVELKGSDANRIVWVYAESDKGNISLDRCAAISRELSLLLDANGWHEKKYTLNVSSPGLDRPLRHLRQYVSNLGRKASVTYLHEGSEIRLEGVLSDAEPEQVRLELPDGSIRTIPFEDIRETKILPSFK